MTPLAAEIIADYIEQVPFLELSAVYSGAIFAMEGLKTKSADVIFLDINLPKLKGYDFIRILARPPQIIITTAYRDYALDGYELNITDYLLKPISFSRFLMAVNKLKKDVPVSNLPEALLFLEAHGSEALSTLFDLRISLLSKQVGIAATALLGKDITLAVETENGGPPRYLNGICTRFAMNGRIGDYHLYEARLRPWLWLASRRSDSKIFQQQKGPDIVEAVLGKYGFPIKRKLSGSYRTWDYCVLYHETDLNFVSRIMEHEGIYYFFEHAAGKHTLVLADRIASHAALPGRSTVNYIGLDAATVADEEHFYAWRPREELVLLEKTMLTIAGSFWAMGEEH